VIYRYLLRPIGLAIRFTWRYTFGALLHGIAVTGRWLSREVFRPAGRVVRAALGLRR
jgi:hypothetical protein